jgi:hypothetical protein
VLKILNLPTSGLEKIGEAKTDILYTENKKDIGQRASFEGRRKESATRLFDRL